MPAHVTGLRELRAAFQRMPEVVRDYVNDETEWASAEGARIAQANLERSPSIDTRALYGQIGWAMNRKAGRGSFGVRRATTTLSVGGSKVRVKGIVRAGSGGGAAGGTNDQPSRRAHFVEFGTVNMRAEPFMLPAAESMKAPYLDRLIRAGRGIERDMSAVGGGLL